MPSIQETAYPCLKTNLSAHELATIYTPTPDELALSQRVARSQSNQLAFLVQLKTFQRLGYPMSVSSVPAKIVRHIATAARVSASTEQLAAYDGSRTQSRYLAAVRDYLNITLYGAAAEQAMTQAMERAALTKHDLADLMNVAIEELVRQRFELPAFSTVLRFARQVRQLTTIAFYGQVTQTLGREEIVQFNRLFIQGSQTHKTPWERLKEEPGKPVLSRLKAWIERLQWLSSLQCGQPALSNIPSVKVKHFAAEAQTLDAARMKELDSPKRYTLAVALLSVQYARALDDLAELSIKRLRKLHHKGKEALALYRLKNQKRTDELIDTLRETLLAYRSEGEVPERFAAIGQVIGERSKQLLEDCDAHMAYVGNNYFPFLLKVYRSHRAALLDLLDVLPLHSSTQDMSLEEAIRFVRTHRRTRKTWLSLEVDNSSEPDTTAEKPKLDISWIPAKWWALVTGQQKRRPAPEQVHRLYFELCVFSHLLLELQSGDLYIEGSHEFGDYYRQLIDWQEYSETVADYGKAIKLPVEGKAFVAHVQQWLTERAAQVDRAFPDNTQLNYHKDRLVLSRPKRSSPPGLSQLKTLIAERIQPIHLLDALADTEAWLNWTRFFGPISGYDAKLDQPTSRYLATVFCYGCQLGPSQMARSLEQMQRRQLSWVHHRHISEETLQKAIVETISAYNRFTLPRFWGSSHRASVDGTKWDIYENNLLAEYHIRYGGYGGVGYYHVSDTYIALFSHFIPCGVWEAVYILDGLLNNSSEIQPDTIHGDTQAQSATVFALAYLLGITLMPRIRGWQNLTFHRPSRSARYEHLDSLFDEVTDWELIETHLPDMLRVVMSIKSGKIQASTILRKLGTNSRKNKLFQAFHELGTAVRTGFLLQYLNDPELRATIQSATNKSESFNRFAKWIGFGREGLIASNDRDQQRKQIKYNHLVANCLIFYNVSELSRILNQLAQEGHRFSKEALAALSPYITDSIIRFGSYHLNSQRSPAPLDYNLLIPILEKQMPSE